MRVMGLSSFKSVLRGERRLLAATLCLSLFSVWPSVFSNRLVGRCLSLSVLICVSCSLSGLHEDVPVCHRSVSPQRGAPPASSHSLFVSVLGLAIGVLQPTGGSLSVLVCPDLCLM